MINDQPFSRLLLYFLLHSVEYTSRTFHQVCFSFFITPKISFFCSCLCITEAGVEPDVSVYRLARWLMSSLNRALSIDHWRLYTFFSFFSSLPVKTILLVNRPAIMSQDFFGQCIHLCRYPVTVLIFMFHFDHNHCFSIN